jgi:hypothetical protein
MIKINFENRFFISILFIFLFSYVILRSIFVEPLLDELGTLFSYIQTGNILNDKANLDANNHILNSYVSHYFHLIFGNYLFVIRLFSVLSFPVFFFGLKKLIDANFNSYKTLIFISLLTIHWIFDYFSLSRGYSSSLAFFIFGLSLINNWNTNFKLITLILICLNFILSLLSNLSLIVPILLIFCYLILTFLINFKNINFKHKIYVFFVITLFFIGIYFIYEYINKLKESGALWWGSKDGLWEVTGKSVSETIFFTSNDIIKYFLIALSLIMLYCFIVNAKKIKFKFFVQSSVFWLFSLFILSILSIVFLVKVFDVNYPKDRVAMYLVILMILSYANLVSSIKKLNFLLLLLLWFPISFVYNMNLNTTIFSPQDRINKDFFDKLSKKVRYESLLSADYVAELCYSYASRKSNVSKVLFLNNTDTLMEEDYHLQSLYSTKNIGESYTCVLEDSITKMKLYRRNNFIKHTVLIDTLINGIESKDMYIPLLNLSVNENFNYKKLKISTESTLENETKDLSFTLIQEIKNSKNETEDYNNLKTDWYFGNKTNYAFNYSRLVSINGNKNIIIYYYNPNLSVIKLDETKIKISAY